MTQSEQLVIDRGAPSSEPISGEPWGGELARVEVVERAARNSLRAQVARLERELSAVLGKLGE